MNTQNPNSDVTPTHAQAMSAVAQANAQVAEGDSTQTIAQVAEGASTQTIAQVAEGASTQTIAQVAEGDRAQTRTDQLKQICVLHDIPDQGAIEVELGDDSLVVLRYGRQVWAYHNICPHAGRPLNWAPGKFLLSAGQLVCAAHGASFKPENGECIGGPCKGQSLKAVGIQVHSERVYVQFPL